MISKSSVLHRLSGLLSRTAGKTISGLLLAQATVILVGFGVATLLARNLGTEGYGVYVFSITVVQVMMIPLDFGIPTLVMREVAVLRHRNDWALLSGLLRWSASLITLVSLAYLIAGVAWWTLEGTGAHYFVAILLAWAWASMRLAAATLRGMEKVVLAALPDQVIRPTLMLAALSVAIIYAPLTPVLALALQLASVLGALFWSLAILAGPHRPIPSCATFSAAYNPKTWIRSVVPLGLQTGAGFLHGRTDILMLGVLTDNREVAIYGLAALVGGVSGMPQVVSNQIIAPKLARLNSEKRANEIGKISRRAALFVTVLSTGVVLTTVLFGQRVVHTLIGSEFEAAVAPAVILGVGFSIAAAIGPTATILNMLEHEKHTARVAWLIVSLNILLNCVFIPQFGANGAALATAVSMVSNRLILQQICIRELGIRSDIAFFRIGRP